VVVNVSWIVLNWRQFVPLVLGVIFFMVIIAGLLLYTIFLVREIRLNEQQDSFLNASHMNLRRLSLRYAFTWRLSKAGSSTKTSDAIFIASC